MKPSSFFRFCPACGAARPSLRNGVLLHCGGCGFHFHFNPAVSVSAFLRRRDGRILLIRRARAPGRGKLAPPGGFVDIGETAEDALLRELREEVGVSAASVRFLCSSVNRYRYRGVTYPVVDLFFTARVRSPGTAAALDDVREVGWFDPSEVDAGRLAFPSMRTAWARLREDPGATSGRELPGRDRRGVRGGRPVKGRSGTPAA
ncbi:MAG: NUDIX domain-containing protein [Verrucomicrobiales bacterium]|nr:NUDIX domain-containing protein [Verrucomicrobiales bacterium]